MVTIKKINVNKLHKIKVRLTGAKALSIKVKLIAFLLKRLDCEVEYDVVERKALEQTKES